MNYSSPRSSRSGAHPKDDAADGGTAQGATPAAEQNAADPGSPHARADAPRACGAAAHESHALAPRRRQMPAVKPEVIIEIPPPVNKGRRFVWLGAGVVPLIITVIALSALAIRSQRESNTGQEATVEALVAMRLAEERRPQHAVNAALEATVEARVAIRLAEERAAQSQQPLTVATGADEPIVSAAATDNAGATPVVDESAPFYGRTSVVLNLRQGPGEKYDPLELIPAGTRLRLLGRTVDSGWYFVSKTDGSPAGETGWVAAWLVTIPENGDPLRLAVVSPLPLSTQSE